MKMILNLSNKSVNVGKTKFNKRTRKLASVCIIYKHNYYNDQNIVMNKLCHSN